MSEKPAKGKVRNWYVFNKDDPNDMEGPFSDADEAQEICDELNHYEVGYMDDDDE